MQDELISRQAVEDKLLKLCNKLEGIFANIRMQNQDESVCGLCEYDCPTPYECPGFDTEDCFKLAYEIRYKWQSTEDLPSVKPQESIGHWIRITNGGAMKQIYLCSVCHRQIEDDGIEALITIKYPYCHCGARMESEKNE